MSRRAIASLEATWTGYRNARRRFFRFRHRADLVQNIQLAVTFAALTGIAAQIRIPLPITPVPITMQTVAVLLTGIALGGRWGGASQAMYVGFGAAGVPWFTGMGAGLGTVFGPTGGYLVGFVFAAAIIGFVTDRFDVARRLPALIGVLFVANFVVIYGFGVPWLFAWLTLVQGGMPSPNQLLTMGLYPFVIGDVIKLLGAAALAKAMIPSGPYRSDIAAEEATTAE